MEAESGEQAPNEGLTEINNDGENDDCLQDLNSIQPFLGSQQPTTVDPKKAIPNVKLCNVIATTIIFKTIDIICVLSNVVLIVWYYKHNYKTYFILSLTFYVVPYLLLGASFGRCIYRLVKERKLEPNHKPKTTRFQEVPLFVLFPQIAVYISWKRIFRNGSSNSGNSVGDEKEKWEFIIQLAREAIILSSATHFLQYSTQFLLQWYILAQNVKASHGGSIQIFSLITSLLSLTYTMVMLEECVLFVNWKAIIITFLWKLFSITSRIITLALCTVVNWPLFAALCAGHWITFTLLVIFKSAKFNLCQKVSLSPLIGIIYVISDMNIIYKNDFPRRFFYYVVTFLENIVMLVIWILFTSHTPWYYYWFSTGIYMSFFTGLFFLRFQYELHYDEPNKLPLKTYVFGCCLGYPEYKHIKNLDDTIQ